MAGDDEDEAYQAFIASEIAAEVEYIADLNSGALYALVNGELEHAGDLNEVAQERLDHATEIAKDIDRK